MSDDKNAESVESRSSEDTSTEKCCGAGCNCGTTGSGLHLKWIICALVLLAAAAVVAAHVSLTRRADKAKQGYASVIPVVATSDRAKPGAVAGDWGVPLKSLAELNVVGSNTEAVFVVLPVKDSDRTAAIQKEVSAAASTITARGTKIGTFLLSGETQEYAVLAKQVGTPAVLAMYKGRGMAAVQDKQVTQENLLKAFVGASRPSSCCSGGGSCGGQ